MMQATLRGTGSAFAVSAMEDVAVKNKIRIELMR